MIYLSLLAVTVYQMVGLHNTGGNAIFDNNRVEYCDNGMTGNKRVCFLT